MKKDPFEYQPPTPEAAPKYAARWLASAAIALNDNDNDSPESP